jgi:hypothetical protein
MSLLIALGERQQRYPMPPAKTLDGVVDDYLST